MKEYIKVLDQIKVDRILIDFNEGRITDLDAVLKLDEIGGEYAEAASFNIKLRAEVDEDKPKNITDLDVICWRDDIGMLIEKIKKYEQNRFTSLVITKLEEALMWAGRLK